MNFQRFEEKVAKELNINQETVRQSVKDFLGCQPYKIKQCQNLIVANKKMTL